MGVTATGAFARHVTSETFGGRVEQRGQNLETSTAQKGFFTKVKEFFGIETPSNRAVRNFFDAVKQDFGESVATQAFRSAGLTRRSSEMTVDQMKTVLGNLHMPGKVQDTLQSDRCETFGASNFAPEKFGLQPQQFADFKLGIGDIEHGRMDDRPVTDEMDDVAVQFQRVVPDLPPVDDRSLGLAVGIEGGGLRYLHKPGQERAPGERASNGIVMEDALKGIDPPLDTTGMQNVSVNAVLLMRYAAGVIGEQVPDRLLLKDEVRPQQSERLVPEGSEGVDDVRFQLDTDRTAQEVSLRFVTEGERTFVEVAVQSTTPVGSDETNSDGWMKDVGANVSVRGTLRLPLDKLTADPEAFDFEREEMDLQIDSVRLAMPKSMPTTPQGLVAMRQIALMEDLLL